MLRFMRAAANTFVAKLLLLLLVGSFLMWGIADFVRERPDTSLASVGTEKVTASEFQQTLTTDIQRINRATGQNFTLEQAQAFGLPARILARILAERTLDQDTKRFSLSISETDMVASIMADPQFAGIDGKFDRRQYESALRNLGMNETSFVHNRGRQLQRQMIAESYMAGLGMPKLLQNALGLGFMEERKIASISIPLTAIPRPAPPTDDVLKAHYETTKTRWQTPEFRNVQLLSFMPSDAGLSVSDAELKAAFEAQKATLSTPEIRRILQIVLPDAKAGETFKAGLASKSFTQLAEARGEDPDSFDLGFLTKADVLDDAVRAAAFSLKEGESIVVPNGKFGPVAIQVTDIEPEKSADFESAKADIHTALLKKKVETQSQDLEKQVDDSLANNEPFADIAKKFKLTFTPVEAVDKMGLAPDGTPVAVFSGRDELLKATFNVAEGFEITPVKFSDGAIVWVNIAKIMPAAQQPFDVAKPQVTQSWILQQQFNALQKKADDIAADTKSGKSLKELAARERVKLGELAHFTRQNAPAALSEAAISTIFSSAPQQSAVYFDDKSQSAVVFSVVDVRVPAAIKDGLPSEQAANFTRQYQDDVFGSYVLARQSILGAHINQPLLNKLVATPGAQ